MSNSDRADRDYGEFEFDSDAIVIIDQAADILENHLNAVDEEVAERTKDSAIALGACSVCFVLNNKISPIIHEDTQIPLVVINEMVRYGSLMMGAITAVTFVQSLVHRRRLERMKERK